jgi:hypothetical protein
MGKHIALVVSLTVIGMILEFLYYPDFIPKILDADRIYEQLREVVENEKTLGKEITKEVVL